MKQLVALALVTVSVSISGWAQEGGTITGVVVDETGKPLAKADVHIAEKKDFAGHRLVDTYETNHEGRFLIGHVAWGTYIVEAGKENAGYPDTKLAFYSNLAVPTVTVAPAFPNADVRVQLGPKAGFLELAPVRDTVTGKKIESVSVTLRRAQNPNFFITTSGTATRIPVPAEAEVILEVSAPGYKIWPPPENVDNARLRLKPEEVRKLQVNLEPDIGK